jgi:hypothetical protein
LHYISFSDGTSCMRDFLHKDRAALRQKQSPAEAGLHNSVRSSAELEPKP